MLEEAEAAAQALFDEDEILVEIICPTLLQPFDPRPLADSVRVTGALVSCEEGSSIAGFGSEALSRLSELGAAPCRFRKLGFDGVIPSAFEAERDSCLARATSRRPFGRCCHDARSHRGSQGERER